MNLRGKHLNSGIRGGLWEDEHLQRMGPAVWLFGWLVHRQTRERHGVGLVLAGSPLTYEMISQDTGMAVRTLKRWMARLVRCGYVRVKHTLYKRMIIQIAKAKKFGPQQLEFPQQQLGFPQAPFFARKSKGPLPAPKAGSKGPIVASSSKEREIESERQYSGLRRGFPPRTQIDKHASANSNLASNPSVRPYPRGYGPDRRTLREMEVRAELRVGAGPEIHRE
ncbi:MAG: hypothetical protein WA020_07240 [Candidatus Acidiferrales bacterium]